MKEYMWIFSGDEIIPESFENRDFYDICQSSTDMKISP